MSETTFHQFKLRLPLDLFRKLETAAAKESRSISAELIQRIEQSFRTDLQPVPRDNAKELRSIVERLDAQTNEIEAIKMRIFHDAYRRALEGLLAQGVSPSEAHEKAWTMAEVDTKLD